MFRKIALIAAVAALPLAAQAEEPTAEKKPRLICRTAPAPTGSMRAGKRTCKTAAEWKALDRGIAEFGSMGSGAPVRSEGNTNR